MKVSDLIEMLQAQPQDWEVRVCWGEFLAQIERIDTETHDGSPAAGAFRYVVINTEER